MRRRIKVGDVEVGAINNPDPSKTNFIVYRFRPRTGEYLSRQEAFTALQAENLFTHVVRQEEIRQERAAAAAQAMSVEDLPAPHYHDHPYYARF